MTMKRRHICANGISAYPTNRTWLLRTCPQYTKCSSGGRERGRQKNIENTMLSPIQRRTFIHPSTSTTVHFFRGHYFPATSKCKNDVENDSCWGGGLVSRHAATCKTGKIHLNSPAVRTHDKKYTVLCMIIWADRNIKSWVQFRISRRILIWMILGLIVGKKRWTSTTVGRTVVKGKSFVDKELDSMPAWCIRQTPAHVLPTCTIACRECKDKIVVIWMNSQTNGWHRYAYFVRL